MEDKLNKNFEDFMKLYKEGKVHFSWRKNSFILSIEDNDNDKDKDEKELRDFISKLVNALRQKVIKESIGNNYSKYENYVERLLEYDPEIKSDIITRIGSNVNICNSISYEVLTKRNEQLEPICYSILVNLNLERPNYGRDLLEQINFELSAKDLRMFSTKLNEAIAQIEELNTNMG